MSVMLSVLRDQVGLSCAKCDSVARAIIQETDEKSFCDLGKLTFNPMCSMCGFLRGICQRMVGLGDGAKREAETWMQETNFRLWVHTAGRNRAQTGIVAIDASSNTSSETSPGASLAPYDMRGDSYNAPAADLALFDINHNDNTEDSRKPTGHARVCILGSVKEPRSWWRRQAFPDPVPGVKNWYKGCLDHEHHKHHLLADPGTTNGRRPKFIHVVDCVRQCIIKLEHADLKYAALSYVWGEVKQFMLTSSNYTQLLQPGSLTHQKRALPLSIRDAMNFCERLEIKYLWIDALCIIQDDAHDKNIHIENMDSIYRQAILTIVSAAGDDANAGLPALHPQRMSGGHGLSIQGMYLYEWRHSWGAYDLSRPTWMSRAWTYQEAVLSGRMVIFTADTVFCVCSDGRFFFDPLSERIVSCDILNLSLQPSDIELTDPTPGMALEYLATLDKTLECYVRRNLTKDEDNLNAFMGVIKVLEPLLGPFWHGLPLNALASSLHSAYYSDTPVRVLHLPSWSWAGWRLGRMGLSISLVKSAAPLHRFTPEGKLERIPPGLDDQDTDVFPVEEPTSSELEQLYGFSQPGVTRDHLVVFWAWEVELYIHSRLDSPNEYDICKESDMPAGDQIMEVRLGDSFADKEMPMQCSCIVFAITAPHGLVHPMLIDRVGNVAYRANFVSPRSFMKVEAWMALKPKRKLVILA